MIIKDTDQLQRYMAELDPKQKLYIDTETISFDDARGALRPYHGDKIAGIAMVQKGVEPIYVPLRHRDSRNPENYVLPYDETIAILRDYLCEMEVLSNLNLKFDLHFLAESDGIEFPKARFEELKVKARLVHNFVQNYKLETLAKIYNKEHFKDKAVEEWLEKHGLKDYGCVPLKLIGEYGCKDTLVAMELDEQLEARLPDESREVWDYEIRLQRILFESERKGIPCDPMFFRIKSGIYCYNAIKEHIQIAEIVDKLTVGPNGEKGLDGPTFNPGSSVQLGQYFAIRGIQPVAWGKTKDGKQGAPSWNSDALEEIAKEYNDPLAQHVTKYNEYTHQESTFCTGYMAAMDEKKRIHSSFDAGGTNTGRLSSYAPNFQNPPPWVWEGIMIPPGMVGVHFDASQIEYRISAHYRRDERLLKMYAANPWVDFHQILADFLSLPRDICKTMNFMILYGAGQAKIMKKIIAVIIEVERSKPAYRATLRAALRRYVERFAIEAMRDPMELVPEFDGVPGGGIAKDVFALIAKGILTEFHAANPSIKQLLNDVKGVIRERGYVVNYFGRRFQFEPDKAYIALNYLCQGTAADIFKRGVVEIFEDPIVKQSGAEMIGNIHDAVYAHVPIDGAQAYLDRCYHHFGRIPPTRRHPNGFRVPILIDSAVAFGHWNNKAKIKQGEDIYTVLGGLVNGAA